jgi:ATP-dependent Clp protease ATP-binding subunit ClpA
MTADGRPVSEPSGIRRLFSRMRQQSSSPTTVLPDVRPDLLNRLSPAALKTLSFAQEEAKTLGHRHIGTEHLLLALTRDPEFAAYKLLEQMAAVPATVRDQVVQVLVPGPEVGPGALTLTPRARLALELAHRASTRIGVPQTGTEHLLIGLAAESEGIGARTLGKSGISAKAAEHQVTTQLDGKNDSGSEDARRG